VKGIKHFSRLVRKTPRRAGPARHQKAATEGASFPPFALPWQLRAWVDPSTVEKRRA
jgi:hypothetical protein